MDEPSQMSSGEDARALAVNLLNRAGCRILGQSAGKLTVGIWRDTDCAEIQKALKTAGCGPYRIVYLDSPKVPAEFKVRRKESFPTP
jgi:hypothetical protein